MQLQDHARSAWKRLPLILLIVAAVIVLGTRGGSVDPRYTAGVQVLYAVEQLPDTDDIVGHAITQMRSLAEITTSPEILQPVIDRLGLDSTVAELSQDVSATVVSGTYVLTVSATSESTDGAEQLASAVAESLVENGQALVTPGLVNTGFVPTASAPTVETGNTSLRDLVKNLVVGLVLAVGLSVLVDLVDPRVRSRSQLRRMTSIPVVGEISPRGSRTEGSVAAQLLLTTTDLDRRVFVVLPAGSGEVQESITQRLAAELAQLSSSTLVISEGDQASSSFSTRSLDDTFVDQRPSAVREQLKSLSEQFDTIIVVAKRIESSGLPLIIARFADSTVIVIDRSRDTRRKASRTIDALQRVGAGGVSSLLVTSRGATVYPGRKAAR